MTRLSVLCLALVLGLAACDETDTSTETRSDQERLVGTWKAETANLRVQGVPFGIPVADLADAGDEQTFTFRTDDTFSFRFDPADGRRVSISYQGTTYVTFPLDQTVSLAGVYSVDDLADEIMFSTVPGQTADDFRMGYAFGSVNGAASIELIAEDPETLTRLFGIASGDAARVGQVVTGGSIRYTPGT